MLRWLRTFLVRNCCAVQTKLNATSRFGDWHAFLALTFAYKIFNFSLWVRTNHKHAKYKCFSSQTKKSAMTLEWMAAIQYPLTAHSLPKFATTASCRLASRVCCILTVNQEKSIQNKVFISRQNILIRVDANITNFIGANAEKARKWHWKRKSCLTWRSSTRNPRSLSKKRAKMIQPTSHSGRTSLFIIE